ncbi:MAG: endonuclease/exonuclease/phosphatase family protein [Anaerolineales bacterium]|nr:endonuclease/exonuclease/phosphatase family protein [Chloroflexota bacterium]MBL6982245.1 endonuclease/exonuclease/phosphatase family protein [Anaerolineales bacterium]
MKNTILLNIFWAFINVTAATLFACTLVGFLGTWWWIFDLISHFRVQYLLGLSVILFVYRLGKRLRFVIITAIFFSINLILVLPFFIRPTAAHSGGRTYQILYANVRTENPHHHLLRKWIEQTDPDFIALLEVNQVWLDDLSLADQGYHFYEAEARSDNFGVALYSRYPLEVSEIHRFGRWDIPTIIATMSEDDTQMTFVVTHPVPPKSEKITWHRNIQMSELADYIAGLDDTVILAGDLNATSWSPFFGEWLKVSQLRDSRRGFGIQPTWPTYNWLFLVPIDHFLITSDVYVHEREVGPDIDSDHYPLLMEFSLSDKDGDN